MGKTTLNDVKEYFLYEGSYPYKDKPVAIDDVILLDNNAYIKEELLKFLEEMKTKDALRKYGLSPTKTIYFAGEPGLGKTYSAKMLSTQLQYPLYIVDVANVMKQNGLDAFIKIFEFVRDPANQPCILFLDECDGVATSRENTKKSSADKTGDNRITNFIMQILQEELDSPDSDLLIFAATNYGDAIDEAFLTRFQLHLTFYCPENYIPFIELEVKKNKMFELKNDIDDETIKTVNIYAHSNNYSIRALNASINWIFKQEIIRRKKNGQLDGGVVPIKLSQILKVIARNIKLALDIDEIQAEELEEAHSFENLVENNLGQTEEEEVTEFV